MTSKADCPSKSDCSAYINRADGETKGKSFIEASRVVGGKAHKTGLLLLTVFARQLDAKDKITDLTGDLSSDRYGA